jgi:hypothetical protein
MFFKKRTNWLVYRQYNSKKQKTKFLFFSSLLYVHTVQNNISNNNNENKRSIQKEKIRFRQHKNRSLK